MDRLELERLRIEIRNMHRHSPLYRLLRDELMKQGRWKHKPRGITKRE